MNYKKFYLDLIQRFLNHEISRGEIANLVANEVPIDCNYEENAELLRNCEWALRHMDDDTFFTIDDEISYYLRCLKGDEIFSKLGRDAAMQQNS